MTALQWAAERGHFNVVKVLLRNEVDVNHACDRNEVDVNHACETEDNRTALHFSVEAGHVTCALQLLCFGAAIDSQAFELDKTQLLRPINDRLKSLRAGERIGTSLMSVEERRFMWNLAFSFTIKHRAAAFKAYYAIRSFITFHGIFMGPGYELGEESIWAKKILLSFWRQ